MNNPHGSQPLRHFLPFRERNQSFRLEDERIENERACEGKDTPNLYYHYQHGRPVANVGGTERRLGGETVVPDQSILAQRRDPETYPEISYLANAYDKIRVYREWSFGRNTVFREPQKADMRNDRLEENFANLGLFLNRLRRTPKAKTSILRALRDLYELRSHSHPDFPATKQLRPSDTASPRKKPTCRPRNYSWSELERRVL